GGIGSDPCADGNTSTPQCGSQVQYSGGPISVGIRTSPIRVTNPSANWSEALGQLGAARNRVSNMVFRQSCTDTLAAVGVSPAQVVQAAASATFSDALTSADLRSSLYANTAAATSASSAFGNQTIAQWFSSDASVMAAAALKGQSVYFRFQGVDRSDILYNSSKLIHELLHNITGLTDDQIGDRLGIPEHLRSEWITSRIYDDCF
ncbi:MAG: hypothetical protein R2762_27110, partial [Bryobacteraceae bacterium]